MAEMPMFSVGSNKKTEEAITVAKIEELFEYVRLKDKMAYGLPWNAGWTDKPYQIGDPPKIIPAHIHWKNVDAPKYAYVAIVENRLEYRYGEKGEFPLWNCPVTTNEEHIKFINDLFFQMYEKFDLPGSLKEFQSESIKEKPVEPVPSHDELPHDKIMLLKTYLKGESSDFFYDILTKRYDILMWVDWREEDDAIIRYCEDILHTGSLSAVVNDSDNKLGFDVVISYKGEKHIVAYPGKGADRNTTIITLNKVISPDYEIRFCEESDGSDTLAFLPLSSVQWDELENEFGAKKVNSLFPKISKDSKLF